MMTQALTVPTPTILTQALKFGIGAWIHEKFGQTKSEKNRTAYTETITAFRQLLQREGLDLAWAASEGESEAAIRQRLALYAQAFASNRLPGTANQRLPSSPAVIPSSGLGVSAKYDAPDIGMGYSVIVPLGLMERTLKSLRKEARVPICSRYAVSTIPEEA